MRSPSLSTIESRGAPASAGVGAEGEDAATDTAADMVIPPTMVSRWTRAQWYGFAGLAAVVGAAMVLTMFHGIDVLFPFVACYAILPLVPGGLGPMLLAGWGAGALSLLDADYAQTVMHGTDAMRLSGYFILTGVSAVFGERARQNRLYTLERESRLAGALTRIKELYARTQEFEVLQRAERDLLKGILDTSIAGVIVVDMTGAIIFSNARAEEVLGLRSSELVGRRYDAPEWHHTDIDGGPFPDDRQPFQQVRRSRAPVFDVRHGIRWPDGRSKLLSINGAPLFDEQNDIEAIVFGVTDITATIAAERELRARDQRLDEITSVMPGIVFQYTRTATGESSFPYISEVAEESLGVALGSIMQSPEVALSRVHPDDIDGVRASIDESQRDLTKWDIDFRLSDVDRVGQWRWLNGQAIPTRADDGATIWNGVFVDVSDRHRLEDELRQVQRIESVGQLAGGIAHDFNNVLTTIIGEASLLSFDATPGSEIAVGAEQIRAAAESGAALSRQLLGFARRHVMSPRTVEARAILDRAVPLIRRLLRERIELALDVADEAGCVRVDPALFDQVLMNLAVNASDAMPDGGVFSITCRVGHRDDDGIPRVKSTSGKVVVFDVRDTGAGMTEETRRRAFEPFFTTKDAGKGSGLGLATSYGIVTQAGGAMSIRSVVGHGTVVTIALPVADGTVDVDVVPGEPTADGHETLMVVDDDEPVRRVTAATLRRRGYHVLEAPSGAEALRVGRSLGRPVDLLVTDVVMPGMTGVTLARAYLAEALTGRVLYVSGYPEGTVTQHGIIPDGVELLTKPFDIRELSRRVRQLLDQPAAG